MKDFPSFCTRFARFASCVFLSFLFLSDTAMAGNFANPGDQLSITVYNHPDLSEQVRVDSAGGISLSVGGYLLVRGKSLAVIATDIKERLRPFIKYPAVDVQSTAEVQQLFIAGGPGGVLAFSPGETLEVAISDLEKSITIRLGQQISPQNVIDPLDHSRIDFRAVAVQRSGRKIGTYNAARLLEQGLPGPLLFAGDTLVFRDKPISVSVSGAVVKPGLAYLYADEPLSDAVDQVGGVLPTAATSHIELQLPNGAKSLTALGDPIFARPGPGAVEVYIPVAPRIQVNGLVAHPGPVTLQTDFSLLGAINNAGGINKFANIKDVQVTEDGQRKTYDITKLTYGDQSQNPILKDGDVVFLPEGHKIDFTTIFADLANLRDVYGYR